MTGSEFFASDRNRVAWWLYLLALGAGVAFIGYSFVGMFVLGVFLYYAARPICERVGGVVDRDGVAAALTLLGVVTPILLVVGYVVVVGLRDAATLSSGSELAGLLDPLPNGDSLTQSQQSLVNALLNDPDQLQSVETAWLREALAAVLSAAGAAFGLVVLLSLSFGLAFFLLRDDDRIAAWFREELAPPGTTGYAYADAVDEELETVFFGNVVFVFAMAVLAAVVYYGFNVVAPPALTVPFALLLALLTGVASLVPLVVGKVVYVPVVAYLAWVAVGDGGVSLLYPLGLLVVSFLVLDILPQTFLQPYISGNQIHTGVVMFAYLLGPMLFGWYGFFLLPLFVVLVVQAVRIVVTDLVHGEELSPSVDAAPSLGERDLGETSDGGNDDKNGDTPVEDSDERDDERDASPGESDEAASASS